MEIPACYIRKYSKELINKLKELGYKYVAQNNGTALHIDRNNDNLIIVLIIINEDKIYGIDCKENEELFLALAALNNDTDKNQWFVKNDDFNVWTLCNNNEFHVFKINPENALDFKDNKDLFHKATIKEIIKHFK